MRDFDGLVPERGRPEVGRPSGSTPGAGAADPGTSPISASLVPEVPKIVVSSDERLPRSLPEIILGIDLIALVVFISYSVLARYIFNRSVAFADEFGRLLFVWLVFLGSAIALRREEHLGVALLHKRLSGWLRRAMEVGSDLLVLMLSALFCWYGFEAMQVASGQRLPVMRISAAVMFAAVPVSAALMTVYSVVRLERRLRGKADPERHVADAYE